VQKTISTAVDIHNQLEIILLKLGSIFIRDAAHSGFTLEKQAVRDQHHFVAGVDFFVLDINTLSEYTEYTSPKGQRQSRFILSHRIAPCRIGTCLFFLLVDFASPRLDFPRTWEFCHQQHFLTHILSPLYTASEAATAQLLVSVFKRPRSTNTSQRGWQDLFKATSQRRRQYQHHWASLYQTIADRLARLVTAYDIACLLSLSDWLIPTQVTSNPV
jgi:hypothetical protein